MPIDPNIALQSQPARFSNDSQLRAFKMRELLDNSRLRNLQMQQAQMELDKQRGLNEAARSAYQGGEFNYDTYYDQAMRYDPMGTAKLQQEQQQFKLGIQKLLNENRKSEIDLLKSQAEFGGRMLANVKDPITYQMARSQLVDMGYKPEALPEQYDPNWVRQQVSLAQSVDSLINQAMEERKFSETKRHNRATENKPTADIQEYNYAVKQGYKGTFEQFQKEQRKAGASRTEVNVGGGKLSPGQEAVDKEFAKAVYVPFVTAGGFADAEKNIRQLEFAQDALKQGGLTGPLVGSTPDFVRIFSNPESLNVREAVEEVVQRNLREILGAQFTEKEGERLISRAYNERLSEEQNAERLQRLVDQIKKSYQAKVNSAQYFEENGTLKGWKGKLPTVQDFYNVLPEVKAEKQKAGNEIPRPTTQEEFDALPSGTVYIDPDDNKKYRKE